MSSLSHYDAALGQLHSTLKWLIASAGATAAVIVAGLQLDSLAGLGVGATAVVAIAGIIAMGTALALLVAASRVLTLPQLTVTDISNREMEPKVVNRRLGEPVADDLVAWIAERRTYLLGTAASGTELYADGVVAGRHALDELSAGRDASWRGTTFRAAANDDRETLASAIRAAEERLVLVERAVHSWQSQRAYKKLTTGLVWGGAAFALSVVVLTLVPALSHSEDEALPVNEPVRVRVVVEEPRVANLPDGCAGSLSGVAVGGTFEHPRVVLIGTPTCSARTIDAGSGVVVYPLVPGN